MEDDEWQRRYNTESIMGTEDTGWRSQRVEEILSSEENGRGNTGQRKYWPKKLLNRQDTTQIE